MKNLINKIDIDALTEEQRQYILDMYASALSDTKNSRDILVEPHNTIDRESHTFHNGLCKGAMIVLADLFGSEPFNNCNIENK